MDSLLDLREQANAVMQGGEKLSVMTLSSRPRRCPAGVPESHSAFQGDQILRRGAINIGVAVAIEGGY